jgi:hypothetical protein
LEQRRNDKPSGKPNNGAISPFDRPLAFMLSGLIGGTGGAVFGIVLYAISVRLRSRWRYFGLGIFLASIVWLFVGMTGPILGWL